VSVVTPNRPAARGAASARGATSARALPRASWSAILACLLAACLIGLLAATSPLLGLGAVLALALVAVVVADLALGIIVFAVVSFSANLNLGTAATGGKLVGFVVLLSWLASMANGRRTGRRNLVADERGLVVLALLFLSWNVLSAAWAQSPHTALSGSSRYAMNLALLPIVYTGVRSMRHLRWVAAAFVAGALLSVAYGALAGANDPGTSRLAGALGDANETAMALVAAATLAVALAPSARRGSLARAAFIAGGVAALAGIIATGSRGGYVALAVTGAVAVAVADRWRGRALALVLTGAAIGVVWFVALAPADTKQHVLSDNSSGRATLWLLAERAIAANPVAGLGTNNFYLDSGQFLIQPGTTTGAKLVVIDPHVAHNVYLELWADLGIVGLALFLSLVAAALRCALRAARALRRAGRTADELLARGLVLAIVGMLAADFFISDMYSKQLWLLVALCPALLAAARDATSSPDRTPAASVG
jgi:O-antigen ligase